MIDHYDPHIVTAQDYYPFGMLSRVALPNSGVPYKFGFNGKMNDNDVKGGLGNQQDYGMRIRDPRIGRFLSVDPLTKEYPELTPYQFASNRPIDGVDLDGGEYLKTIPKFEYSGNNTWKDYVSAVDNAAIDLLNLVPTSWNSLVSTTKSLKEGTYIRDLKNDAKQLGSNIKQAANKFVKAPLTTLTSPEGVEFIVNAWIGAKTFSPVKSTGNLMEPVKATRTAGALTRPHGVEAGTFKEMSNLLNERVGNLTDDMVVQGSRANGTALPGADLDIALKLTPGEFSKFIGERFKNVNVGSAKEKTFIHAFQTGKIQAGEAGLSSLRKELEKLLGMEVDLSVIKKGGVFDNGSQMKIPKTTNK